MIQHPLKDIVIYGTGAIGSVLATFLQVSNKNQSKTVHLVGRDRILNDIKQKGLIYQPFDEKEESIKTQGFIFHTDISSVSKADVIFISIKAHNLEKSLKDAQHLLKSNPIIFLTMNGLGLKELVSKFVKEDRIIECVVNYPSNLIGNTVKNDGGNSNILVKNTETEDTSISQILQELFDPNTLDIRVNEQFTLNQWKKAMMNIGMNAISAITMLKVGEVLERKTLGKIIKAIIHETIEVAQKLGIDYDEDMVQYFWRFAGRDPDHFTSTYQDIVKNRPTEVEFMNGFIVKKAEDFGIDVPANESVYKLMQIAEKLEKPEKMEKLEESEE